MTSLTAGASSAQWSGDPSSGPPRFWLNEADLGPEISLQEAFEPWASLPSPSVMSHPDRWRLDQHLKWEEKRMALAEAALDALVAPDREPPTVTELLPQPKRRRRPA